MHFILRPKQKCIYKVIHLTGFKRKTTKTVQIQKRFLCSSENCSKEIQHLMRFNCICCVFTFYVCSNGGDEY